MTATVDALSPFELVDPTKVGYGAATMWLSPTGTAMPADTVNLGDDWRTTVPAWSPVGATDDGIHYSFNPTTNDLTIEESPIPAAVLVDALDVNASAIFAEDVLANLRIAIGVGTIATTSATTGVVGKSTLTLNTTINKWALGIEHVNPFGHWTRVCFPIVMAAGQVQVDNRRAAAKRMYATTLRAVCLPSQITVVQKTAESTG